MTIAGFEQHTITSIISIVSF